MEQLVVPQALWEQVLHLTHDPLLEGHQALEWTLAGITQWFYWPGIKTQVQHYCLSCPECQGKKGGPLCPLPILTDPFERVGIDIVCPLYPLSCHKYILMVVDYATHYPEALPL